VFRRVKTLLKGLVTPMSRETTALVQFYINLVMIGTDISKHGLPFPDTEATVAALKMFVNSAEDVAIKINRRTSDDEAASGRNVAQMKTAEDSDAAAIQTPVVLQLSRIESAAHHTEIEASKQECESITTSISGDYRFLRHTLRIKIKVMKLVGSDLMLPQHRSDTQILLHPSRTTSSSTHRKCQT
jgi:hypothetical protein